MPRCTDRPSIDSHTLDTIPREDITFSIKHVEMLQRRCRNVTTRMTSCHRLATLGKSRTDLSIGQWFLNDDIDSHYEKIKKIKRNKDERGIDPGKESNAVCSKSGQKIIILNFE